MPDCPHCGAFFAQKTTGGRPRRFCSDACRKAWNAESGVLKNEISWFRDPAEDAEENARLRPQDPGSWAESAAKYRREADELEKRLDERRYGVEGLGDDEARAMRVGAHVVDGWTKLVALYSKQGRLGEFVDGFENGRFVVQVGHEGLTVVENVDPEDVPGGAPTSN